jgi:hypothetical protein
MLCPYKLIPSPTAEILPLLSKKSQIFRKKLLTLTPPCDMMNSPVKKGYFFAAIFQLRAEM